jgi:hypothetical protein
MIKIDGNNQRAVRETTVPFEYTENGEVKAQNIRLRYYAETVKEARDRYASQQKLRTENPGKIVWLSESLVGRIESLPDLKLPGGSKTEDKQFEITVANLDQLDVRNLEAMQSAILQDTAPKATPEPSPAG